MCLLLLYLLNGCAAIPYDYPRPVSSALHRPEGTGLGKKVQARAMFHPGESGFYLLPTGLDAFTARALLIDRAEKTLDLQYYIFHDDLLGRFVYDRLLAAADRGVRVRLLLDDWHQTPETDLLLASMATHPNLEVRLFNPFGTHRRTFLARALRMAFGPDRLRGRLHNKAFIADNSVAIVGGRNIGAEYFGTSDEFNFYDVDILAAGPIAREASANFDEYWNCVLALPVSALVRRQPGALADRQSPASLAQALLGLAIDLLGDQPLTFAGFDAGLDFIGVGGAGEPRAGPGSRLHVSEAQDPVPLRLRRCRQRVVGRDRGAATAGRTVSLK